MAQDEIVIYIHDRKSAEIEEQAGAVGEAFHAHEGSKEEGSGSQPRNLNYRSDEQEVLSDESVHPEEMRIHTLAELQGLEPTKNNLWKVAFEDFRERYTIGEMRLYKKEGYIRNLQNQIYRVVGFFSAFQGLLITAAAQSKLLRCNNVGFILALFAFATAGAVCGIWQKITVIENLRSDNISNKHRMKELAGCIDELRRSGPNFKFDSRHRLSPPFRLPRTGSKKILLSYGIWLLVSFIAFGGLCMLTVHQIVCDPGHSLPGN